MTKKICIVAANYYPKITKQLIIGSIKALDFHGLKERKKFLVSGIFEIPIIISKKINDFDAFVALGCVIKGKTPHFNLISKAVIDGIMDLSIRHKKPIGNGIITCLNMKQALERSNPQKKNKGGEAVMAILSVVEILKNDKK